MLAPTASGASNSVSARQSAVLSRHSRPRGLGDWHVPHLAWRSMPPRLLTFFILMFAVANIAALCKNAPAFNKDLRIEGTNGDWRVRDNSALLTGHDYFRAKAYQLLLVGAASGDDHAFRSARKAAREALDLAPEDAFAWLHLAWADYMLADDAGAREALARSWQSAPEEGALAFDRLLLAEALGLTAQRTQSDAVAKSLERDVAMAGRVAPKLVPQELVDTFGAESNESHSGGIIDPAGPDKRAASPRTAAPTVSKPEM